MPAGLRLKLKEGQSLFAAWFLARRFSVLLGSFLLTLFLPPLLSAVGWRTYLIEGLFFVNLSAAAAGAGTRPRRISILLLVACAGAMRIGGQALNSAPAQVAATLIWIAVAGVAAVRAIRFAMRGRRIDTEHICAALSAYMLVGHLFGFAYWLMESAWPGSFTLGGQPVSPQEFDLQSGIYFSFATIATLGYGDISPLSPVARNFAVGEALMGQFYLAVLVARLVGAYASRDR